VNAFGVLFLMIGFIMLRTRLAAMRLEQETSVPEPFEQAGELA